MNSIHTIYLITSGTIFGEQGIFEISRFFFIFFLLSIILHGRFSRVPRFTHDQKKECTYNAHVNLRIIFSLGMFYMGMKNVFKIKRMSLTRLGRNQDFLTSLVLHAFMVSVQTKNIIFLLGSRPKLVDINKKGIIKICLNIDLLSYFLYITLVIMIHLSCFSCIFIILCPLLWLILCT